MHHYEVEANQFSQQGYTVLNKPLPSDLLLRCENRLSQLKDNPQCHVYKDRNGRLRRLENFTDTNDDFKELNQSIVLLLKQMTGYQYCLFKDKINFKPPMGEGFHAHYDGIFKFNTSSGSIKNGWYEYCDSFINVLITLVDFTIENGCLEISSVHREGFDELYTRTKQNGTPDLNSREEMSCSFVPLLVRRHDIVIFDHRCPHRSGPNKSDYERGSIYLTYNLLSSGDYYQSYFNDKIDSTGKHKSLTGPSS